MWSKIKYLQALLSIPRLKLPYGRILITVDLDQPSFDSYIKKLIEIFSIYEIPLTTFANNGSGDNKTYEELRKIIEFANKNEVVIEIGSHSITHEDLTHKEPYEIVSIIRKSVTLFRREGIPIYGFRAPYLSIERTYCEVFRKLAGDMLKYDSSVLFEGNLFYSRMHDLLPRKCPHKIANIWELPLSCLDDFNLFNRLGMSDEFVSAYWKRKVDINIRNHNYFLLLIHPHVITSHSQVLENLLAYCIKKYSRTSFATCYELVKELNKFKQSQK
jgi:peptidoglycan/xylan/chitin deacetylase (PgdA/CDA1 family)